MGKHVLADRDLESLEETVRVTMDRWHQAVRAGDRPGIRRFGRELVAHVAALNERLAGPPKRWTKLERCKHWLIGMLGTISRSACEIYGEAELQGFNEKLVQRALAALGATHQPHGWRKRRRYKISLSPIFRNILSSL